MEILISNIKYLIDNGCNIWNQDAYRWYLQILRLKNHLYKVPQYEAPLEMFIGWIKKLSIDELPKAMKIEESDYKLGDLGKVYGHQWRNQNGVDQIQTVIDRLKSDPMGRYAILDAWNPSDFSEMALPPCHLLYQFNCREMSDWERKILLSDKEGWNDPSLEYMIDEDPSGDLMEVCDEEGIPKYYLDLQMYQRSCDTFLGVPFNIASGSLLLSIIAKIVNMETGKFIWIGGDTHIYENHLEQVDEQLSRVPTQLPKLNISDFRDLSELQLDSFNIENYTPQATIRAELKTGL